ncbi:hypothetical protein [Xanthomonas sp. LMG 12462]|uniref:hypothetical protein n=1 Tax=Xanthomonas sp. LMG 12462 TaxID=1591134 RepID=UPI001265492D|nr:hypothetical protein [Xanthomonas sp. LMG 12462]
MKTRTLPILFLILVAAVACDRAGKPHAQPVAASISLQSLTVGSNKAPDGVLAQPITVLDALTIEVTLNSAPPTDAGPIEARFINLATGQVVSTGSGAVTDRRATLTLNPKDRREWEPGRYLLEVSLGGSLLGTRDIDVSAPGPAS